MNLPSYVGKKYFAFTTRGNTAIKQALGLARSHSDTLFIQDEGGWMTYEQFGKKAGFTVKKIPTRFGVIEKFPVTRNAVLLINSLPGYTTYQPMDEIMEWAKQQNMLVINDVAGSIVYPQQLLGDILIGSFGKWKPLNVEEGGFIACDEYTVGTHPFAQEEKLQERLTSLQQRMDQIKVKKQNWIRLFTAYDIIHHEKGFNFYVLGPVDEICSLCKMHSIPYTICPRYIRTQQSAVSIETKRFF